MTGLLSIVRRELAVGARQTSTHRLRLFAGGAVIGIFALFLVLQSRPANFVGPMIFGISSFFLFVQALFSGVRYTADALSEERREGTLGLLFLTELRSSEVVLGKMIVRSLRGFYALVATLPVFTFCILLGGVTGLNALYMALLLLTTMIFSLAACIFVSSRSTEDKSAFIGSLGILAAFAFIPLILWKICFTIAPRLLSWDFLLYPSPLFAYHVLPASSAHVLEFLRPIACLYLLSLAFLFLAARNLTCSFQDEFAPAKSPTEASVVEEEPVSPTLWDQMQTRRIDLLLNQNPFRWLLTRENFYPKLMRNIAVCIFIAAVIGWIAVSPGGAGMWTAIFVYGLAALHWFWKLLVASHALRRLHDDHRSGALEILLVTPIEIDEILSAQLKYTFEVCQGGAMALCVADAIIFKAQYVSELFPVAIGGAIFLFIDARTIIWLAMLQALKPSRFPAAVLRVIGITLLPPVLTLMLIIYSGRGFSSRDINALFFFWYVACGLYDLILIRRAKRALNANFRTLASEGAQQSERILSLPKPLRWLLLREPTPGEA